MKYKNVNMLRITSICLILLSIGLISASVPCASAETYTLDKEWQLPYDAELGQYQQLGAIAISPSGDIYVADTGNSRIQKFDGNGNFVSMFGSPGEEQDNISSSWGNGNFTSIGFMTIDGSGNIYICDGSNWVTNHIEKFDSNGNYIATLHPNFFIPYSSIGCIAADNANNLYVCTYSPLVDLVKTDSNGNLIVDFGANTDHIFGVGNWTTDNPTQGYECVAADANGNFYISSASLGIIEKFDSNGNPIALWGSLGSNDGQFAPNGAGEVAIDSQGNVYVTDYGNMRIQKFDNNGGFITSWHTYTFNQDGVKYDSAPYVIAVDASGNVYVIIQSVIQRYTKLEKINPVIVWNDPSDISYGISLSSTQLNAVSSVLGTFIYSPEVGTVLEPGLHTLHVDFTPTDTANYNSASKDVTINVMSQLVANFTSNVTNGNAPLSVQFNDTSTGSPTSWSWEFGDGNTSTEKDPTYTFLKPGSYTVTLTASNAEGVDSFSQEIKVTELNFDVNPPKIRISDNVEFDAYKYTDELHGNFFWEFGDGTYNESGNSIVTHNYSKPGSYTVNLSVRDSDTVERNVSKTINVTIPVVLVHGWKGSSDTWQSMSSELQKNGFEVWNFDYRDFNTADPRTVSPKLAAFIEEKRNDLSYNGQKYNGKIDIICHSMGAIVSRLYMEKDDGGIHGKYVRQWIGIAPAHNGSAFADLNPAPANYYELLLPGTNSVDIILYAIKLKYGGPAVDELKTTSDSIKSLGALSPSTKYWVIAGWNPKHSLDFGDGWLSATRAKVTSGTSSTYYWTYSGDMIIATEQSYDDRMEFEAFPPVNGDLGDSPAHEFDHTHICSSQKVIAYVIDCLKDTNKNSTKEKPPIEEVSFFNNFMKIIRGKLGTTEQYVDIPVSFVPIGSNNGANLLMVTSSDSVSVPDTSSSSENMLSTTLEWDEGDITMTLTSPSGMEYSEDSRPNDVWYTKNGNSISYIVTAPESGNWTAKLIPAKYPGRDIQYNLTYLVRTINVSGSSVLPVANFTGNVTEGTAPLSVQFTDMSQNATGWNWDFGDNNSSTEQNPTHTYTEAGNYTVKLSVSNPSGLGNITKPGCVIVNVSNTPVDNIGAVPYAYITVSNNVSEDNGTVIIEDYGTVMVINTATNKVTVTVPVGSDPYGVAVTPDRTKVYVANQGSDTVSVIDTATNTVISTVDVGNYPKGVAVNPDGTKVYVTNYYSNTVSVIDTSTNTVTATVSVGDGPNAVAVSPDGKNVYVVNFDSNTASVIDTSTNTVIDTVIVGPHPQGIAVSPDGKNVYVAETSNNTVSVINTSTNTITAIVSVGSMPIGVVVSPDGEYAYVANSDRSTVSVIDTSTNAVKATVSVGIFPGGVAITPDGKKVYVTNFEDVSVIDTSTNIVTTTVSVAAVSVERWINNIAISQLPESILPVANFSSNLTSGYAPLSVQFTDLSENAAEWSWDFGDGTNSTEQNPTHTYSAAGNYTVSLTAINANGTDSKSATINVSVKSVLSVLPGYTNPPTDLDYDNLYEDINGNGMLDFDDVVAYYDNMEWIEENVQLELFDYNKNGLIDFDDVVKLYDML